MSEVVKGAVDTWKGLDEKVYSRVEVVENTNKNGVVSTRTYAIDDVSGRRKQVRNIYRGNGVGLDQAERAFLEGLGVSSEYQIDLAEIAENDRELKAATHWESLQAHLSPEAAQDIFWYMTEQTQQDIVNTEHQKALGRNQQTAGSGEIPPGSFGGSDEVPTDNVVGDSQNTLSEASYDAMIKAWEDSGISRLRGSKDFWTALNDPECGVPAEIIAYEHQIAENTASQDSEKEGIKATVIAAGTVVINGLRGLFANSKKQPNDAKDSEPTETPIDADAISEVAQEAPGDSGDTPNDDEHEWEDVEGEVVDEDSQNESKSFRFSASKLSLAGLGAFIKKQRQNLKDSSGKAQVKLGKTYISVVDKLAPKTTNIQENGKHERAIGKKTAVIGALALAGVAGVAGAYFYQRFFGADPNHIPQTAQDHINQLQATNSDLTIQHLNDQAQHLSDQNTIKHLHEQLAQQPTAPSGPSTPDVPNTPGRANSVNNLNLRKEMPWTVAHQVAPGNETSSISKAMSEYGRTSGTIVKFGQYNGETMIFVNGRIVNTDQMEAINKIIVSLR